MDKAQIQKAADGIRKRVLEHTIKNNGGYMSQACSSAEIFASLYLNIMNLGAVEKPLVPKPFPGTPSSSNKNYFVGYEYNGPRGRSYDRFILSPTHYSLVLYAALIEAGRMDPNGLAEFNKDGSSVEMIGAEHSPGMEVMTGSLGQGLSQGIGMALARKMKKEPGRLIMFMSDGEFQIGMTWEAFQFMAHHELDNIIIFVDVNGQQCDGAVTNVMKIGSLEDKVKAFGAEAVTVDGHDIEAIISAAKTEHKGRPLVVFCSTDPCQCLTIMRENGSKLHYLRFKNDAEKKRYEDALAKWGNK